MAVAAERRYKVLLYEYYAEEEGRIAARLRGLSAGPQAGAGGGRQRGEMKNPSIENPRRWRDGELEFTEIIYQEYANCRFSAGFVAGHPVDTLYLQAEKDGQVTTQLLLRPDEIAAIAWVASGALWSWSMDSVSENGEAGGGRQRKGRIER